MDTLQILKDLNYLVGTTVIISSLHLYLTENAKAPLYISLAIVIAGPVEDLLICVLNKSHWISPDNKDYYSKVVDYTTSLAFLIFLGLAILNC